MIYQEDIATAKEAFDELLKVGLYKGELFSDLYAVEACQEEE